MDKKIVLITGAARGLGKDILKLFLDNNYICILNYNNSKDLAKSLKETSNDIILEKCDLSNELEINNMVNDIISKFGRIDVLINNAAICNDTDVSMKTKGNFMKILETNLVGPFLLSRLVGDIMLKNKFGKIINIASTNGIDTYYPESLDYDASKAGLISLTHNLAKYYAPYVNVNCILPGWMNTDMNKNLDSCFKKAEEKKILLGRFADPKEVAKVVYFLASDDASYINNSVIRVDGGKNE